MLGAGKVEIERLEMEDGWNRSGCTPKNLPHAKLPIAGEEEISSGNPKITQENFH